MINPLLEMVGNFFSIVGNVITIFGFFPFLGLLIFYFVDKKSKDRKIVKYLLWGYGIGPLFILLAILCGVIAGLTE